MKTACTAPPSRPSKAIVGLEAVDLPAEGVAAHGDVEAADGLLVGGRVEDPVGEQDHPGAGAVRRQPVADGGPQRLEQVEPGGELDDRGRLAAGEDQPVDGGQLLRAGAPAPPRRPAPAAPPGARGRRPAARAPR